MKTITLIIILTLISSVTFAQKEIGTYISLSTGICAPTGNLADSYTTGFNLNGQLGFSLSRYTAMRFDLNYNTVASDPSSSIITIDGSTKIVNFQGNFIAGNLNPDTKFAPYFVAGFGFDFLTTPDVSSTFISYINPYSGDTTFTTTNINGSSDIFPALNIGGGLIYKIKKNFGIYSELNWYICGGEESANTFVPFRFGVVFTSL